MMDKYLTRCRVCGGQTSKKHARINNGLCAACAHPESTRVQKPTRNERIIEHGYMAYAVEEGHYDNPMD